MGLIYCNEILKESDFFDNWLFGPFNSWIKSSYISLKHL